MSELAKYHDAILFLLFFFLLRTFWDISINVVSKSLENMTAELAIQCQAQWDNFFVDSVFDVKKLSLLVHVGFL